MRWDDLFADLEMQLAAAAAADRDAQVAELTRAERATVLAVDRLRGTVRPLEVTLRSGEVVRGRVADAAASWLLLQDEHREHLVPIDAVATVRGAAPSSTPATAVARRLGLGHALRAVSRNRDVVRVRTSAGAHVGRVDAVGADHLDVGLLDTADLRPTGEAVLVRFAALQVVSRL